MVDEHGSVRHLMLLPSLACQAQCSYCFGPNRGPVTGPDVFALDPLFGRTNKPVSAADRGD
jgi:hypothetical protein